MLAKNHKEPSKSTKATGYKFTAMPAEIITFTQHKTAAVI